MAKDYKRYGKTGQFRKPIVGDPTGPIRRQAEQVGESLRKGQIRTDEYGRDYVRGLEKTHSNLLDNFNTNKQLTDAIFKTREYATALRGKREVEYLNSIADEFGKKAAYWEEFSTTYSHNYWKAASYIYNEIEKRQQAKQIKEDETRKDDKDDGITERNRAIDDATIKEESRITQEGIKVQRLGDYTATKYTTGLARRKLQPVIANNLADRIIADTGIQNKFESRLQEEKTKENDPLILNSDNVYQLYVENAYRILKETGIRETSPAGQKILNHWFELAGKAKNKLYGEEQVELGKINVLNAYTVFKNNTNAELHPVRLENLVTTVMNAWEWDEKSKKFIKHSDKTNRHTDGWIPTFKYLIDNDYYAGDGGEQRLIGDFQHIVWDENGPTGVEFGTKFSKQGTREELLKYLRANTTSKVTAIKDDRKATDNENILKMHQYVGSLPDGLSSQKAEDDFHNKFIQGRSENDAVKIEARKILNYRSDHAKWVTHSALKEAYRQGDVSEFTYHFYTLTSTEKEVYKGMFKVLSSMQKDNGSEDVFTSVKTWSEEQVVNTLRVQGYVESQARANIDSSSLKYGSTYLQQLQLEAYESLEGKYTGKQRIFESKKLALEEFKKIPIIEVNDDNNNTGKRLFAPYASSAVDDSTLSSETVLDKLQGLPEGERPQMLLPNGKVNPEWQEIYGSETETGTYKEGPFSQERVNGVLKQKNVLSKTSISEILYTVSIGEDQITIPENIRLIWAHSDKSRSQTELLNYALKAQGYTSKDNLIPLTPVDILQKEWPKKIAGISPRHYSKLVPYFLTNDGRLLQQTALQGAE